jgi:hypothetical protein
LKVSPPEADTIAINTAIAITVVTCFIVILLGSMFDVIVVIHHPI